MQRIFLSLATVLVLSFSVFGQSSAKVVAASEIIEQFEKGGKIAYENVTIAGDLDLTNLPNRTNDAVYPEKNKTARVYSAKIAQPISFKNVVFNGKVDFFRKAENAQEISEYRLQFGSAVVFENCIFNQTVDLELTNFDAAVSFADSVFKAKPSFIRIGLQKTPDFTRTVFENGSIFKNFQADQPQNLSAAALSTFYANYLKTE